MVEKIKNATWKMLITALGMVMTFAVYIRFTHETANEAKACCIENTKVINGIEARISDKVYDRVGERDHQMRLYLDLKFGDINKRLSSIEAELK